MKYDFDTPVDRRNTGSIKWDVAEGELPMWVADMDFRCSPEIVSAVKARAEHGIFGYSAVTDEWYDAYVGWWKNRHGLDMDRNALIFSLGVVPSVSSIVRKLTTPAEKVLLQTPVYNIFFNSVVNNGRYVIESPLVYSGGAYSVDFEDLENKMSDPQTTLMILCNPHNPVGKIWARETLAKIGSLAEKYHVIVLSDEIHCDITAPDKEYVPFASVSDVCRENSVTCIAPTKAFNFAGLHSSAVYVPNPALRARVERALNTDEVAEPNAFSVNAAIAAFTDGGAWLDGMREYVFNNRRIAEKYIRSEISGVVPVPADATYLIWLDCSAVTDDADVLADMIRKKTGLYISSGSHYGEPGRRFLRMNIACPRVYLEDGLKRLKRAIVE